MLCRFSLLPVQPYDTLAKIKKAPFEELNECDL